MRTIFTLIFMISLSYVGISQGNAADFDGIAGYIEVEDASAYVSKDAMTIEAWVYPRNENPAWPDFDGILGLRNEADCDFYLLQLSKSSIEARFRNSDGNAFDINSDGLKTNQWNHLALTFGNNKMVFYLNGIYVDEISTDGICSDVFIPFTMGKLNYDGFNDFYFDGKLDEVRFWSEQRSEEEIEQYYNCQITNPEDFPTLSYYYKLDETTGATNVTDNGDIGQTGNIIPDVTFDESTVDFKVTPKLEEIKQQDFAIYPNPSFGSFTVDISDLSVQSFYILDISGQKINCSSTLNSNSIQIEGLNPGTYFIHIKSSTKNLSKKLVVS